MRPSVKANPAASLTGPYGAFNIRRPRIIANIVTAIEIDRASPGDFAAMWPIFEAVVAAGDTYALPPETPREEAYLYWFGEGVASFVAKSGGQVVGMYKLVANQPGLGSHVANASFMVAPSARGLGVGRAMGRDCLRRAREAGFLALQFNFVVSTNESALALWKDLGFAIVGTLPRAFRHATRGFVDAYVMYRWLDDGAPTADPAGP